MEWHSRLLYEAQSITASMAGAAITQGGTPGASCRIAAHFSDPSSNQVFESSIRELPLMIGGL
jgi:hypothetical protein